MSAVTNVRWSASVDEAGWIADRLNDWGPHSNIGVVIPRGFDAYVRVLHPAHTGQPTHRPVRWTEMAEWSGADLHPDSALEDVALPLDEREGPRPWNSPPRRGSMTKADLDAVVDILRRHTAPASDCWFCIWDGYGWDRRVPLTRRRWGLTPKAKPLPDPVPKQVRSGPRVQFPHRSYLLYQGRLEDAMAWIDSQRQSPNLWWPADRSWCVATEIDLPWTYIGGSTGLAADLLSDRRIEAQAAQADDPLHRTNDRLKALAAEAARELMAGDEANIATGVGTLRMWIGDSEVGPKAVIG